MSYLRFDKTLMTNLEESLQREIPVSYTHLDVYKRQLQSFIEGPSTVF